MANTTNFGWETPDDTDLVKDGAAAMRTLGNSIDASFVDLKGGTTGQILSKNSNTDLDFTWIANDQGDITAVTAGTGLTGGGTAGAVTLTNDMATTITASGDIVVGTGSGTYDNLPIGTTGQVLTADTTVSPYKVKWAATSAASFVGCVVKRQGVSTSISGAVDYTVAYTTEQFDTDGFHDNSTNNTRITIPTGKGGKYQLSATINNESAAPGTYQLISLKKNGSLYTDGGANTGTYFRTSSGSQNAPIGFSTIVDAVAGDYFEIDYTQQNSGTVTLYSNFCVGYLGA